MKRSTFDLSGSVVLITGAAGGIGREAALAVARCGAAVVLGDVDDAGLHATEEAVRAEGGSVAAMHVDVREPGDTVALAKLCTERFGRIDGALCIAGVIARDTILTTTYEGWKRTVDINLTGTFLTVQAAAREMLACGAAGSIVTCSSGIVVRCPPAGPDYSASKLGILALTKSAAGELGPHGIRVNAIAPGAVNTAMPLPQNLPRAAAAAALRRVAEPEDLSGSFLFLLSPESGYITGHTLHVNGGLVMA
jgi:NAD(P)-dependent dehydrogenase (short-subunit alcohol dehydrogenase family)